MPLSPEDQARIDYLADMRNALIAAGFTDSDALAVLLAEVEFGPLVLSGQQAPGAAPTAAGPTLPALAELAGRWSLSQPIQIDCGLPGASVFQVDATELTVNFTSSDQSAVRLVLAQTGATGEPSYGTLSDLGGGDFEILAVSPSSKVRIRLRGSWVDRDTITAQFRFEFKGSVVDFAGIPGLLQGCGDVEQPETLTRA